MINIEEYKRKRKEKDKKEYNYNFFKKLLIKTMICILLFLIFLICIKKIEGFDNFIYETIYSNNISFAKINSWYNSHFGTILPINNNLNDTTEVFDESISYSKKEEYMDGVLLEVKNNYLVPSLSDGIIVYIGEKEKYGKTIIVEDSEEIETWYCNIEIGNLSMYDYIKKGDYLGQTIDNKLILVFKKKGKVEDYKKYI